MKRFLFSLLGFAMLILILDLPFRWVMRELPDREYDNRLRRVLNDSMRYDVLVFGSSRAARDVLPSVITEHTGITAYSLGYPGANIEFQEFVLRMVLRNAHRPRMVLLILDDPSELMEVRATDFRLDRLHPLAIHPEVNAEICRRTVKSELLTRLLASYRIKDAISNLWDPPVAKRIDTIFADGSMSIALSAASMDTATYRIGPQRYSITKESPGPKKAFESFLAECTDHGIQLVVVHPPDLRSPNIPFTKRISEIVNGRAEVFMYDTLNLSYRDAGNYYDLVHLNRKGAYLFSIELAKMIKPTL